MIKALIVGINSYPAAPLSGCVNDADDVIEYLRQLGASVQGIRRLCDAAATKSAIVQALRDMIATSETDDHLLFHYSGHGSQVRSLDVSEPDSLDECLCPVDFDYRHPDTALRDDELSDLLSSVPTGVAMTVVLDSCHSGDMRRLPFEPKRFPMPPELQELVRKKPRAAKTRALSANTAVVSACLSNETAADTSFDGRPNGAFTYYWLASLANRAGAGLLASVQDVSPSLLEFSMHPAVDAPEPLGRAPFLSETALGRGEAAPVKGEVVNARSLQKTTTVFERTWSASVLGMDFSVELSIGLAGDLLRFDLSHNGETKTQWSFAAQGATSMQLELGFGFKMALQLVDWESRPADISFRLSIVVSPPFLPAVTLVDQRIAIPRLPTSRSVAAPTSAADLLAMLELAKIAGPRMPTRVPPRVLPRDGDEQWTGIIQVEDFVGGLFGSRYEKNSDNNAFIPPGFVRDHVEVTLDPPNSGNVYFVQWADSDPHIGKFQFHVGCAAFGGGKATFFLHCVRDPNVVREVTPNARSLNGNGNGGARVTMEIPHELEQPMPEGGGSVRI